MTSTWTANFAASVGASEAGLKLILGQILAYPTLLFFRHFVMKKSPTVQHLFLLITGAVIGAWSIAPEAVMHSFACILTTYFILSVMGGSFLSAASVFVFNLGYLFVGYYFKETDEYDVCWTTPHCVLCLRLIAIAMDLYDGQKPESELSKDQKAARLLKMPSLLEMLSQAFFIGGYFVGPQYSMRKYQDFIQRNINENIQSPVSFGFKRLAIGAAYLFVYVVGSIKVPSTYVMTAEFRNMDFVTQSFWFSVWAKIILSKYIAAWLFSEGAFIISGLGYNGVDESGNVMWNGGANVKLRIFEKSWKFGNLVESFNINTNAWVASYVYKRMKFMNNRMISQVVTLIFLAMWHGFHSGYYITFFHEFIVINFEKDFTAMLKKSERIQHFFTHPAAGTVTWIIGKFYVLFFLPHCFMPFVLLKQAKYIPVILSTRCIMLFFLTWPIWSIPLKMMLIEKKKIKKTEENNSTTEETKKDK